MLKSDNYDLNFWAKGSKFILILFNFQIQLLLRRRTSFSMCYVKNGDYLFIFIGTYNIKKINIRYWCETSPLMSIYLCTYIWISIWIGLCLNISSINIYTLCPLVIYSFSMDKPIQRGTKGPSQIFDTEKVWLV